MQRTAKSIHPSRWALLPMRLVLGCGFVIHGWAKLTHGPSAGFARLLDWIGIPLSRPVAWGTTLLELAGGLALAFGAFVELVSVPLIAVMLVAMFTVHLRNGFSSINTVGLSAAGPEFGPPGYEVNLLYVAGLLALLAAGAGPLSVDGWLARAGDDGRRTRGDARRRVSGVLAIAAAALLTARVAAASGPPSGPLKTCPPDAVTAGTACVDKYEASVWRVPAPATTNRALVTRIRQGRATVALLEAGGATQLGTESDDYAPCEDDGHGCDGDVYAASVAAVPPSGSLTWFQAQEACANSGKRLPTNAEWQVAADGTPDATPDDHATTCNVSSAALSLTGARSACMSARGAFDMAGNVIEWVADWVPLSTACPGWGGFSDDLMCLAGASTTGSGPGALLRGGSLFGGGPLAVLGTATASRAEFFVGFRCAR